MNLEFDFTGESLKAEGVERVLNNSGQWKDQVAEIIEQVSNRLDTFTTDDVRKACGLRGLPSPHHANAWGAAFTACAKQGIIRKTGQYTKSQITSNHSRMVPFWTKA
jgi:hypothetical protein